MKACNPSSSSPVNGAGWQPRQRPHRQRPAPAGAPGDPPVAPAPAPAGAPGGPHQPAAPPWPQRADQRRFWCGDCYGAPFRHKAPRPPRRGLRLLPGQPRLSGQRPSWHTAGFAPCPDNPTCPGGKASCLGISAISAAGFSEKRRFRPLESRSARTTSLVRASCSVVGRWPRLLPGQPRLSGLRGGTRGLVLPRRWRGRGFRRRDGGNTPLVPPQLGTKGRFTTALAKIAG